MFLLILLNKTIIKQVKVQKMESETQILSLKQSYSRLLQEDPSSKYSGIEMINKLNQSYNIDRVIMRQAIDKYQNKKQLENQPQYEKIQSFFQYLLKNQEQIERKYLKLDQQLQSSGFDIEINEENRSKLLQDKNYLVNKNSISKFLKDQNQHFQEQFAKVAKDLSMDQKAINGDNVSKFMKGLFETKYTAVLLNGKHFFEDINQLENCIQSVLQMFYLKNKENQEVKYVSQNYWILQIQIIDFLDMWARTLSPKNLFFLYARSRKRLQMESQFIITQMAKNLQTPIEHPSQLTAKLIIQSKNPEQQQNQFQDITKRQLEIQKKALAQIQAKKKSKRDKLEAKMKQMYEFGCKRRYALPKSITFDKIQYELDTMNLEKFVNFCSYYFITGEVFSRELLTEFFKLNALNFLTLDFQRFKALVYSMIQSNQKVLDKLLDRQSPVTINRKKAESQLSKYKFSLKPLDGKSIDQIKQQIRKRRQQKSLQNRIRLRRQMKQSVNKRKISKITSQRKILGHESILDLDKIKDSQFDPRDLIDNSQDQLWEAYQAKIWRKNTNERNATIDINKKNSQQGKYFLQKSHRGIKPQPQVFNLHRSQQNDESSFLTGVDSLDRRLMKGQKVLRKINGQPNQKRRNSNVFQLYQ